MGRTIVVHVEKSNDGTYWGTTQNIPGVVASFGQSLEILKRNLQSAIEDYLELAEENHEEWHEEIRSMKNFEYKLDLRSFFELLPEVKISKLAEKAGLNPSLVRQYARGLAHASESQARKLEEAAHLLGQELQSVRF